MTATTRILAVAILVVLLAGGLYYFNFRPPPSGNTVVVHILIIGGGSSGQAETLSPDTFTVKEGQQVTLSVNDTTPDVHELAIDAFGVNTGSIFGGAVAYASFVANQTGTFEVYQPAGDCLSETGGHCTTTQDLTAYLTVSP